MMVAYSTLERAIAAELRQSVQADAEAIVRLIRARHGDAVAAVLFYGSCLGAQDHDGILDFYVLVDSYRVYHGSRIAALFSRLVPPTVSFWTAASDGKTVRAKVAVISRRQFERALAPTSFDVTLWARFCQPAALVHARDEAAARWARQALTRAVVTAASWAVRLGPTEAEPGAFWAALFRHTYGAELRPERGDRAVQIYRRNPDRYDRLLPPALVVGGIGTLPARGSLIRPAGAGPKRAAARRAWRWRRLAGKLLSAARLVKGAFTFEGGADYVSWKIERHAGAKVELTPWQRRHPVLAAPVLLWRFYRRGMIR